MTLWALIIVLFALFPKPSYSSTTTSGNETDQLALLSIKAQITSDPTKLTSSWNYSVHICYWRGVSCTKRHRRVAVLNLESANLVGTLSPSIGNLSFLKILQLSNNSFKGEIPHEIGRLFRLQVLNLTSNSFGGRVPADISLCSNLKMINLDSNGLEGEIPAEIGLLPMLLRLSATLNNFTGKIHPSFGNLSSLQALNLQDNKLEGRIPDTIGQLKSLRSVSLASNELYGMIPPSFYNISLLTAISLANNYFEGNLPQDMFLSLPNVQRLLFYGNQFSGLIPFTLSNASSLGLLDLSMNEFSNGVLVDFGNLRNLTWLALHENALGSGEASDLYFLSSLVNCSILTRIYLDFNNFGGMLPNAFGNFSKKLTVFSMEGNQISGNIPNDIGNLVGLNSINMRSNQLTGGIPSSISLLHMIQELGLGSNNLSGEIPSSIGNLTLLNQLWLEKNSFQGSIPLSLGDCKNLFLLHLYGNNLSGSIPRQVIGMSSLTISLNLAGNKFSGSLPPEVGNLKNLVVLNLSHNNLSGEIPHDLGGCIMLTELRMDYNFLSGTIPESLGSLKGIDRLDLCHNNLSGKIPKSLGDISLLRSLNLSFNVLEGEVPIGGVFANSSAFSIYGNDKLCGGLPFLNLPLCPVSKSKGKQRKRSLVLKIVLPVSLGVIGISLMILRFIVCFAKRRKERDSFSFLLIEPSLKISYGQLLKSTDGFSQSNVLGFGSFGSVYKAKFDENGSVFAVKIFNLHRKGASKSFLAECEALRNIRHRNLVKIFTACSGIDYKGNDFKALVYEYMENGSLDMWLYAIKDERDEAPKKLNLLQRLDIALDVGSALDYLHNQLDTPIVHCDLKPSNILLDSEMIARVGDFGLAQFLMRNNSDVSGNQISSISVKGTIGYTPPEYGMGSEVSIYGDVYSYGILVIEMFIGKRPTDPMFNNDLNLHKLAVMAMGETTVEFVDLVLLMEIEENIKEEVKKKVMLILGIGVACSMEAPAERMKLFEAVNELKLIRNELRLIVT